MKRTQRKDALRNIIRQFISFLSILIVIALGVGIFLACRDGARAMQQKGNAFYRETNYHDIEVRSTHGITAEDIAAIADCNEISDAEGIITQDLIGEGDDSKAIVHVISRTERMDQSKLLEGTMPAGADECAVEDQLLAELDLSVGDMLTITAKDGGQSGLLRGEEFRITGTVRHPDHFHYGEIENYNVVLPLAAFDRSQIDEGWTGILLKAEPGSMDTFSPEYRERIEEISRTVEEIGKEQAKIRDDRIRQDAQTQIDKASEKTDEAAEEIADAKIKLRTGEQNLEDSKAKASEAEKKIAAGQEELDATAQELRTGKKKLDQASEELASNRETLKNSRKQLDETKEKLDSAEKTLASKGAELEESRQKLDRIAAGLDSFGQYLDEYMDQLPDPDQLAVLQVLLEQYTDGLQEMLSGNSDDLQRYKALAEAAGEGGLTYEQIVEFYNSSIQLYEEKESEYDDAYAVYQEESERYQTSRQEYEEKEQQYSAAEQELQRKTDSYQASLAEYQSGKEDYEHAKGELESAKQELAQKKQEISKAEKTLDDNRGLIREKEAELKDAKAELAEKQEELDAMESGSWILLNRSLNLTWHELKETIRTFRSIANSFALLFILLGVLVCYSTIGKIIDEQKVLVGTTKALGFYRREIFGKYLIFGTGSALFGCIAGLFLAYYALEKLILDSVGEAYQIGAFPKCFTILPAVLAVVTAIVVAILATWAATGKLLRQTAIRLMTGYVPSGAAGRKSKENKQSSGSLYRRLILRNIQADWKRVLITVVSIAGCCTLLIIGFSLKMSFDEVISRQFTEIIRYDSLVKYLPEQSEDAEEEIEDLLKDYAEDTMQGYQMDTFVCIGDSRETAQIICADPDEIPQFYQIKGPGSREDLTIPRSGAVIFNRLAEVYDLQAGDQLVLIDEKGEKHKIEISEIYNNYAGRSIFISDEYAEELFDEDMKHNMVAVKENGAGKEELREQLKHVKGFLRFTGSDEERDKYEKVADALNTVIIVMIFMAGVMAAVVLLNLVRIQISQKKRELTIMRINGFTAAETIGYILRENVLTTVLGIGLGLVLGNLAAHFNLRSIERVELMMIREINWKACLFSVLITLVFAAIVNFLALRKIRHLNLRDIND